MSVERAVDWGTLAIGVLMVGVSLGLFVGDRATWLRAAQMLAGASLMLIALVDLARWPRAGKGWLLVLAVIAWGLVFLCDWKGW